jgi:hypothetical protein
MALIYTTPKPPLIGDGVYKEWQGGATHYTRIDEDWDNPDTNDYVAAANVEVIDEYEPAAGVPVGATGTLKDWRYFIYFEGMANPDVPYCEVQIFLDGVQQGETKEIRTDGTIQSRMLQWLHTDATPFSVDCTAWLAGPRRIRTTFKPSGGGGKGAGDVVDFETNE